MSIEMLPDNPPTEQQPSILDDPFAALADSLPETANDFRAVPPSPIGGAGDGSGVASDPFAPDPVVVRKKRIKMSKKMQKMMDGLRDQVVDIPILWFHQQAVVSEHPEWELDEKEREFLKDAFGVVFEVLDIEIAIQPVTAKLESIWWVIAYPFVAFGFLFLSKKDKVTKLTQQQEGQE
jgi:hypothetical protein